MKCATLNQIYAMSIVNEADAFFFVCFKPYSKLSINGLLLGGMTVSSETIRRIDH